MIHDAKKLLESALKPRLHEGSVGLLDTRFRLLPGVHMVAAVTKHGKTNLAANLVVSALSEHVSSKVVVGLNEETSEDFLMRCGSIVAGTSFGRWKLGQLSDADRRLLVTATEKILERVRIVDPEKINLGCMEDAAAVVKKASRADGVSLVVFDYLQNIYQSKVYPSSTPYELYKLFGVRMKDAGKLSRCPVVVFAQLKEASGEGASFKSRVEGDTWFANNVATGIELKADKRTLQSSLTVQVDRFQGMTHEIFWFDHKSSGRLVSAEPKISDDEEL